MNYKNLTQEDRDNILKSQLSEEVVKILERYRLISTPDLKWVSKKENSHVHTVFTHKFLQKTDGIGALFRINYLCFAKVAYFRENIDNYDFLKYDPDNGFIETNLPESDFIRHKASGKIIDYRFLQRITDIQVFEQFCKELEKAS